MSCDLNRKQNASRIVIGIHCLAYWFSCNKKSQDSGFWFYFFLPRCTIQCFWDQCIQARALVVLCQTSYSFVLSLLVVPESSKWKKSKF